MLLDQSLVCVLERVCAVCVHAHHQRLVPVTEAFEVPKHAVARLELRRRLGRGGLLLFWRRCIRRRRCWPLAELESRCSRGHRASMRRVRVAYGKVDADEF